MRPGWTRGLRLPQRLGADDPLEDRLQLRELDGETALAEDGLHVVDGVGHALQEADLSLEEAPVAVGAHRLHDPHEHVSAVVLAKGVPVHRQVALQGVQVVDEELLPHGLREGGLGVVQEGRDVVLQRSLPPALVVDEPGLAVAQHDVPRLEVPVQEVAAVGRQQEGGEALEVALQPPLVEGDLGQLEEVVLEVVQVPEDRLAIEGGARIGDRVVDRLPPQHLEARQLLHHAPVDGEHALREVRALALAGRHQRVEEGRVAEVLFQVHPRRLVRAVDGGDGEPRPPEGPGVREEGPVLVRIRPEHADAALVVVAHEAEHLPARAIALEGKNRHGRLPEVLLEEPNQRVLGHGLPLVLVRRESLAGGARRA